MKTIFLNEARLFCRNPFPAFLFVFFFATGLYSLQYGYGVARRQSAVTDSISADERLLIKQAMQAFEADTGTEAGKRAYRQASEPASVNYYIKRYACFVPNAFSALAIGQRDVLPFDRRISTERSFSQPYDATLANPDLLSIGSLDFSFVLVYLLPLLLIALSYDVYAREKEQGTFAMLWVQARYPGRLVFYKLLFRAAAVYALSMLLHAVAFWRIAGLYHLHLADAGRWIAIITLYQLFWLALVYAIVSLHKSSGNTVFLLLGGWLFLAVILPYLLGFYVEFSRPLGIKADMLSEQRKIEEDVWAIQPKTLIYQFYKRHPEYRTGNLNDTSALSPRRFAAYYDELERRLLPLAQQYQDQLDARNALFSRAANGVPTLFVQQLLQAMGRSDLHSFHRFERSAIAFQQQWRAAIWGFIFRDQLLRADDYARFPSFSELPDKNLTTK